MIMYIKAAGSHLVQYIYIYTLQDFVVVIRVYNNDTLYLYFTARRQGRTCFSNIILYIYTHNDWLVCWGCSDCFVGECIVFLLGRFGALTHLALWRHMATQIWVSIGSGDGLLSDGTKQFPEPMLIFNLVSCCGVWEQIYSQRPTYL